MKRILHLLQVKQVEDVLLLYLKFTYVANALTIMMNLKIFAPQPLSLAKVTFYLPTWAVQVRGIAAYWYGMILSRNMLALRHFR